MARTNYFGVVTVLAAMMAAASITALLVGNGTASAQSTANTVTVNTTDDENTPSDGKCSLREAIQNANDTTSPSPDCAAGSGEDTISFEEGLSGTITLDPTLGPLTVTDAAGLTVDGGQEKITVSGDGKIQVLSVNGGAKLAVRGLTIADGLADVGCPNGGFGGGIENDGGTLTVTRSTFSGNNTDPCGFGGAIANINGGKLEVVNSTFDGNKAGTAGGGILNTSELEVTYSTFSANGAFAGGGVVNANVAGATTTLGNTIFANNQGGNIRNVCAGGTCQGTINDEGYNISSDLSYTFTDPTSKNSTNPLLDPNGLQDNGGLTRTIALQPTSPAVDAIPPGINGCGTTTKTDQRGVSRPQGPACDIGAFELTKASPPDKDKKKHHKKKHKKKHHKKKNKGGGGGGGISQG